MKISLQRFFIFAISIVFLCGTLTAGILYYHTRYTTHAIEKLKDSVESATSTQLIQQNLAIHRRQALLKGLRPRKERIAQTEAAKKNLLIAIDALFGYATSPEEVILVNKLGDKIRSYIANYEILRNEGLSAEKLYESVSEEYYQAQEAIQDLMTFNLDEANQVQSQTSEQSKTNYELIFSALFLLTVALAVFLLGIRRYFYNPIIKLKNLIENFKIGHNLDNEILRGAVEIQAISSSFINLSSNLAKQNKQQLNFLSSIAHDLKNPLNAIKMSLELISDDERLSSQSRQMISIIDRQTNHLMTLISDLLDTTRIESGDMKLNLRPVDILKIVNDSATLHSSLSRFHEIMVTLPNEPVIILSDEERLSQVFNNLFNNAIKYSPNGGKITVTILASGEYATIEVIDSGVGILQTDIEGIFEPFRRSSTTRELIPGIGLGLSASRKIIRAHEGGDIHVTSEIGNWTKFAVILPIFKKINVNKNSSVINC